MSAPTVTVTVTVPVAHLGDVANLMEHMAQDLQRTAQRSQVEEYAHCGDAIGALAATLAAHVPPGQPRLIT